MEEEGTEVTVTVPWPDTLVTTKGVVEVPVFTTTAPSGGVEVIVTLPAVLATGSVEMLVALVVTGLPPFRPMKAPQPPRTGWPPFRPTPPFHPVPCSGGAGSMGWFGLPPPPACCCCCPSGLGEGWGWPGVFLPDTAEPGVTRPALPGVRGPWLWGVPGVWGVLDRSAAGLAALLPLGLLMGLATGWPGLP